MESEPLVEPIEIKASRTFTFFNSLFSLSLLAAFAFVVVFAFLAWMQETQTMTIIWGALGLFGLGGLFAWEFFTYFPRQNTRITLEGTILKVRYSFWGKKEMDLTRLREVRVASASFGIGWGPSSLSYIQLKLIDDNGKKLYLFLGYKGGPAQTAFTGLPLEKVVMMYKTVAPYLFNDRVDYQRAKYISEFWYTEEIRQQYNINLPV